MKLQWGVVGIDVNLVRRLDFFLKPEVKTIHFEIIIRIEILSKLNRQP